MASLYSCLPPRRKQCSMPPSISTLMEASCCALFKACNKHAIMSLAGVLLVSDAEILTENMPRPQSYNLTEETRAGARPCRGNSMIALESLICGFPMDACRVESSNMPAAAKGIPVGLFCSARSEERRVGKGVERGGRSSLKKKIDK